MDENKGVIESVTEEKRYKKRPEPMNTITLQKLLSQDMNMDSKVTMEITERLYNMGIVSYPRTETTIFSKNINLGALIDQQMLHPDYGDFATKIRKEKLFSGPNNGKLDDKAHPPIHPVRLPGEKDELPVLHRQVYNFIVRHFLA
jgi:DNA topoisomerase III